MKTFGPLCRAWVSCFSWYLGPLKGWSIALMTVLSVCAALSLYWNHEAVLFDKETQVLLKKIKDKRTVLQASAKTNLGNQSMTAVRGALSSEQVALMELRLPPVQATKAAPLGKFLSEAKLKGVSLKQVDYVWSKSARGAGVTPDKGAKERAGQGLGVGKIDVNLNVEGSYPAVRAWLGELLFEESNIQLSAILLQRLTRDSSTINSVISLSVYFQEAL